MTDPTHDNLDDLLDQADWPELPAALQSRLLARWEAVTPARRERIWPTLAVAAASVASGLITGWLVHEAPTRIEVVEAIEPSIIEEDVKPQAEPALPGRAASVLELVILNRTTLPTPPRDTATPAERIDTALAAVAAGEQPEPLFDIEPRTLETLLIDKIVADESAEAATILLRKNVGPAGVTRLLTVAETYDAEEDQWRLRRPVVTAIAALATPAQLGEAARSDQLRGDVRPLLAALAMHRDPAAAGELIRTTQVSESAAREAMAVASDAVLSELTAALRSPRVADRNVAAWLLSGSSDPRVISAAASLLETPAASAALRMLVQSDLPEAAELLREVERSPLRAQLRSIRRDVPVHGGDDARVAMAV